jgi:quinol monooxygenase YgiN
MLRMFARHTAKPDAASALAEILTRLARATSREPGCIAYVVCQRDDAPHVFLTFGQWRNAAASDAHLASPHVLAAIRAAEPLLDVVPDVSVYRPVRAEHAPESLATTDGLSVCS